MRRIHITRKHTVIAACIAVPAIIAAIVAPKAVRAKKRGRYASI